MQFQKLTQARAKRHAPRASAHAHAPRAGCPTHARMCARSCAASSARAPLPHADGAAVLTRCSFAVAFMTNEHRAREQKSELLIELAGASALRDVRLDGLGYAMPPSARLFCQWGV
eukprot:1284602-Pleurochrysis_carterae.AAC.1